jgi:predicted nucleic acid-binding Zn ribbon protein
MRPLTHALPGALAELLRDVPVSHGKVDFAWRAAVGPTIGRATSARLDGRILLVDAADRHWAREITRSSGVILWRLQTLLGKDTVDRIVVRNP